MKISAQLVGPDDEQQKIELDVSDLKASDGELELPPQLNPEVYQYSVKIFRGRDMDIDTSFWGFKDVIDPFITVTIGDHSCSTDVKKDTISPEFNQTIWIPLNLPSMVQNIKLELKSRSLDGSDIHLATEHLSIHLFEKENIFKQFYWVNFFTSINVQNSIGKKMVEGLIDGN